MDDDNIIYPNFFKSIYKYIIKYNKKIFIFSQQNKIDLCENYELKIGNIDVSMYMFDKSILNDIKMLPICNGDVQFIIDLCNYNKTDYLVIGEVLCCKNSYYCINEKYKLLTGCLTEEENELLSNYIISHNKLKKINILEIGTSRSKTSITLCYNLLKHGIIPNIYSLDIYYMQFPNYPTCTLEKNINFSKALNYDNYINYIKIVPYTNFSKTLFKDIKFDVIYIDGGHEYGEILHDIIQSKQLLAENALLCGDDYYDEFSGVKKAVDENVENFKLCGKFWGTKEFYNKKCYKVDSAIWKSDTKFLNVTNIINKEIERKNIIYIYEKLFGEDIDPNNSKTLYVEYNNTKRKIFNNNLFNAI